MRWWPCKLSTATTTNTRLSSLTKFPNEFAIFLRKRIDHVPAFSRVTDKDVDLVNLRWWGSKYARYQPLALGWWKLRALAVLQVGSWRE